MTLDKATVKKLKRTRPYRFSRHSHRANAASEMYEPAMTDPKMVKAVEQSYQVVICYGDIVIGWSPSDLIHPMQRREYLKLAQYIAGLIRKEIRKYSK